LALTKVTSGVRTLGTGEVATANMAVDPTNASNLSSGSVPLAQLGNAPATDTSSIESDIALLGFKVASNGSLSKYNLVDQTEDAFATQDGIDLAASTNEVYNTDDYYTGRVAAPTGGTITSYTDGGTDYTVHSFLSDGDFVPALAGTIDYLLVGGGGGGGGSNIPGGGGAGGLLTATGLSIALGTHPIVIGAGGTGVNNSSGSGGTAPSTTAFGLTAVGGGNGIGGPSGTPGSGGSGAGAQGYNTTYGTGTAGQGNRGGYRNNAYASGGGGGAGAVGGNASSPNGGNGGVGLSNSFRTGSGVFYAGGGGGGRWSGTNGTGGNGGGGAGGGSGNGTANTGGGGGGGGTGTTGGSGIVVIRYVAGALGPQYNNLTLVSNATTAESAPTKGDIVMTYTDAAGTATVNTDLKAYASRDGTNWTAMTLVAQGNTGSASPHLIVAAHDVDISSQPSGTSMKYKIETLNQTASKETRIQAVSLGWS
jgi:hypothetical protein